jgi:transposase
LPRGQQAYFLTTECTVGTAQVAAAFDGFTSRYALEYSIHGKPCVVTLDNASWHTSRAFHDRLDAWASRGVVVHHLPPYCPGLNPIETLWRKIKYDWMPLACYASYAAMKAAVMEILGGFGHKYQISFV